MVKLSFGVGVPLLILCAFAGNICAAVEGQGETEDMWTHVKKLVTYDSTTICIQERGSFRATYRVPPGYFLRAVYYDRISGLISFNKCHAVKERYQRGAWDYELIVWDYNSGKTWSTDSGQTYSGEGLSTPTMVGFDTSAGTGYLISDGWESLRPYWYSEGRSMELVDLRAEYIYLMGVIDSSHVLLLTSGETSDSSEVYRYNVRTGDRESIGLSGFRQYRELVLSQFGKNPDYYGRRITEDAYFYNTDWDPTGRFMIFSYLEKGKKTRSYWFYDSATGEKEEIVTDKPRLLPIWR